MKHWKEMESALKNIQSERKCLGENLTLTHNSIAIVRIHAGRLRRALEGILLQEGISDTMKISILKGATRQTYAQWSKPRMFRIYLSLQLTNEEDLSGPDAVSQY